MSAATFEEYQSATRFARWKYKYGIFVLIACWICLVLLIIYVVIYAEELSTNSPSYMMKKLNLNYCNCYSDNLEYYINKTATISMERQGFNREIPLF